MLCTHCKTQNDNNANFCYLCGRKLFCAVLQRVGATRFEDAYYLLPQSYSIGREQENNIVLIGTHVSRQHARMSFTNGGFVLRDLCSKNGTLVNNVIVHRIVLKNKDIIQIGKDKYIFQQEFIKAEAPAEAEDQTIGRILQILTSINRTFHTNKSLDEILSLIIDSVLEIVRYQRGYLILYNNHQQAEFTIVRNLNKDSLPTDTVEISSTAVKKAVETGELVVVDEVPLDPNYSGQTSILKLNLLSLVCIPILSVSNHGSLNNIGYTSHGKTILGVIYVDSRQATPHLSERRKEILQTLSDQAALAIENAVLFRENIKKKQIDKELMLANKIQQNLLPAVSFNSPHFNIDGLNLPCKQIGGDYYGFFQQKNQAIGISIADVCGKGIPAALLMSSLQAALNSQIKYVDSIDEIVRNLNRSMMENAPSNRFVTFFIGFFDEMATHLKYVNCGHNPALLLRKSGEFELLKSSGTPLGIMEPMKFETRQVSISPGDFLVLYTDGITEAQNAQRKDFGFERLKIICQNYLKKRVDDVNAEMMIEEIIEQIEQFTENTEQRDDITLMVVQIK